MHGTGYVDWHRLHAQRRSEPVVVDCHRRLRCCLALFLLALMIVFGRLVQLEVTQGEAYRREAARPLLRRHDVPGLRGRILASDGTVLAEDRSVPALAVHYRYLEEPPNDAWLRRTARSQLPRSARNDPRQMERQSARLRQQRRDLARRLAQLCGIPLNEWDRRAGRVQARVERIARSVNRRWLQPSPPKATNTPKHPTRFQDWIERTAQRLHRWFADPAPRRITVAEERDYHVIAEDLPLDAVAEIEGHPGRYPGVKIVPRTRRVYPQGHLAAHVLGHLGPVSLAARRADEPYRPGDQVGQMGLEKQYETLLRGVRGVAVERIDRSGNVLSTYREREPGVGRDLITTILPPLQRTAEELLDRFLQRRALMPAPPHDAGSQAPGEPRDGRTPGRAQPEPAGGAVLVMDVHHGAVLAAASAPSFDPNLFCGHAGKALTRTLQDPANPLFDRTIKMAVPPGSAFKVITAIALLESGTVAADQTLFCRGYLHTPDSWRCAIYRQTGKGHGEVSLIDALSASCNVYFFHYADLLGPDALVHWAERLGFGQKTGVDLPGESAGRLPRPPVAWATGGETWPVGETRLVAVGQGALEVTPVQVARMMAAVANGGRLVTPHLAEGLALSEKPPGAPSAAPPEDPLLSPSSPHVVQLHPETVATIRAGLRRAVAHPEGTAHASVHLETLPLAGKTGTAETGAGHREHAWFAAYLPADDPQYALVVALEHAGNAAETACPLAKRIALRIKELGLIRPAHQPAQKRIADRPPDP